MFLIVSPADSTWELKFQLCSLCFLYRRCNEHATWLTTVLMVREVEYNLACLFCEGFSDSDSLRRIEKSEGFVVCVFCHCFYICLYILGGIRKGGYRTWKHRVWHYWIRKFYFYRDTLNSSSHNIFSIKGW